MSHTAEDVKKEIRTYLMVFAALAVLTGLTVAVSWLHIPIVWAVVVALFIAGIKGALVAGFFMHLISEEKLVYSILVLTGIFFLALMLLPLSGYLDRLG